MKEPKAKNNQYILEEKEESVSRSPISNVKAYYKATVLKSIVLTEGETNTIAKYNGEPCIYRTLQYDRNSITD